MPVSIVYTDNLSAIRPEQLEGFFVGWPSHPSPQAHYEILRRSYKAWLALDAKRCVGFVNALSDGIYYAHIPLLEVLPEYHRQGIGSELVRRMAQSLGALYAIDLVCDEPLVSFYRQQGFMQCAGMVRRNYDKQEAK